MYRRQMICGAVLLLFAGMIAAIIYGLAVPRISVEQLRCAIAAGVPIGTSEVDVRTWVSSQPYLHYSGYIADEKTGRVMSVEALIPNSGPYLGTGEEIRVVFFFTNGRLSHVEVKRYLLSL